MEERSGAGGCGWDGTRVALRSVLSFLFSLQRMQIIQSFFFFVSNILCPRVGSGGWSVTCRHTPLPLHSSFTVHQTGVFFFFFGRREKVYRRASVRRNPEDGERVAREEKRAHHRDDDMSLYRKHRRDALRNPIRKDEENCLGKVEKRKKRKSGREGVGGGGAGGGGRTVPAIFVFLQRRCVSLFPCGRSSHLFSR